MIILVVILILSLVALIGGFSAGLTQVSMLLSVIFYILASGAAVKYLLIPPRKRKKEGTARKPRFQCDYQEGEESLSPAPDPDTSILTEDTTEMIQKVDHLVRGASDTTVIQSEAQEPPHVLNNTLTRDLGTYEVVAAGFARSKGYELTLQPKKDGVFLAKECGGTVYITLTDSFEGVGSNLGRLGIQQVFILWDEEDRVLSQFPSGKIQITVEQEAECRFYDAGHQLALKKKGTAFVIRK